jgi:hypothetical protein
MRSVKHPTVTVVAVHYNKRHCTYEAELRRVCITTVAVEKQLIIAYSECASLALGIQHAMRIRHTLTSGLAPSSVFFHILINGKM